LDEEPDADVVDVLFLSSPGLIELLRVFNLDETSDVLPEFCLERPGVFGSSPALDADPTPYLLEAPALEASPVLEAIPALPAVAPNLLVAPLVVAPPAASFCSF